MVAFEEKTPPPQKNSSNENSEIGIPPSSTPDVAVIPTNSEDSSDNKVSTVSGKRTVIEPAVFLINAAAAIASTVLQNQLLFQTCVTVYDYDKQACEALLGVKAKDVEAIAIETEVQPYVANIIMTSSLINSIVPAFLCLFIGPWSDKFGRRPIIVATIFASLLGHVLTTILAGISMATPINPWVYIITNIPMALTGGIYALVTMAVCLVSDVSDERGKARRMFLLDAAGGVGTLVGNLIAGYVLSTMGTIGAFGIATGIDVVAFSYLLIFVDESLKLKHERKESKVREFFKFDLIKDLAKSCVKRRPHYDRAIIWIIMFILVSQYFVTQGETNVFYLFQRNKFNVTLQQFTTLTSIALCIKMIGSSILLLLFRVLFKVPITVVGILALASCLTESSILANAQHFWQLYLAATMGVMSSTNGPMLQAVIAGLVEATEIGKIYAVISSLQTLSSLLSAPVYTGIYNVSLATYPGAFFYLSSATYLLCLVLNIIIYLMQRLGARARRPQVAAGPH